MKRVIIVGSAGQDGRILEKRLLADGCEVIGIRRDGAGPSLSDRDGIARLMSDFQPAEVYYLAAHHHSSQENTTVTPASLFARSFEVHVTGLINYLEAIRIAAPSTRLFYAASSLIFGEPADTVQSEETAFNPRCAYGISKAAGVHTCAYYRNTHRSFAAAGILYNHESNFRPEKFVSKKIIQGALRISRGEQDQLILGDLSARIDWGYAPDFVDAMTRILALDSPENFIVATGELHSVQEFVEIVFDQLDLDWRQHVTQDATLLGRRKPSLTGDATKLRQRTGWRPSVTFAQMVTTLVKAESHGS